MIVHSDNEVKDLYETIIKAILSKQQKNNVLLVDKHFSGNNIKLYDIKGKEMDPDKYIGDYMDADEFYRC